jgi:DNA-directed RNA polymerase specialized sigma24 family protein
LKDGERRKATREQVQSALEALSDEELLKLRHVAVRMAFGSSYLDPQDLVHDAFQSALELRRRWNMEHSFFNFLCGAMRGLASNDRESLPTRSEQLAAALVGADEPDNDSVLVDADAAAQVLGLPAQLADQGAQEDHQQRTDATYALFADDDEITMLLMAMEDGSRGEDIERQCGMTSLQYQAARRRMNRRLAAAFPKRGS